MSVENKGTITVSAAVNSACCWGGWVGSAVRRKAVHSTRAGTIILDIS